MQLKKLLICHLGMFFQIIAENILYFWLYLVGITYFRTNAASLRKTAFCHPKEFLFGKWFVKEKREKFTLPDKSPRG